MLVTLFVRIAASYSMKSRCHVSEVSHVVANISMYSCFDEPCNPLGMRRIDEGYKALFRSIANTCSCKDIR